MVAVVVVGSGNGNLCSGKQKYFEVRGGSKNTLKAEKVKILLFAVVIFKN
jgi:ribosomal protein S5